MVTLNSWPQFYSLFRQLLLATGVLGIGVMLFVQLTAGFIVPGVWGSQYRDSVPILRVLILALPAVYLGFVSIFMANALHLEKKVLPIMLTCVFVNVLLNMISIPKWGPLGAAWTTVISETLLASWLVGLIARELKTRSSPASKSLQHRWALVPYQIARKIKRPDGIELP